MKTARYGCWESPLKAEHIAAGAIRLGDIQVDASTVYWLEKRPLENGRTVIAAQQQGAEAVDILPEGFSANSRAHEYGGGSFAVADGLVFFCNDSDQDVYLLRDGAIKRLTSEPQARFTDFCPDTTGQRLFAIRETAGEGHEPVSEVVVIYYNNEQRTEVVLTGSDFYAAPRLSPDRSRLAWIAWEHPNMPWDSSFLYVAAIDETGDLSGIERVAGSANESVFQPTWSPDGTLFYVSDRNGWWNIYTVGGECVLDYQADFGLPQWVFGMSTFAFTAPGTIIAAYVKQAVWHVVQIDVPTNEYQEIPTGLTAISQLKANESRVILQAGAPDTAMSIIEVNLARAEVSILRNPMDAVLDSRYVSIPEDIYFDSGGERVHAFYYPPHSPDYRAADGEKPPLIVVVHSGPTHAAENSFSPKIQYWTTRGFAVLDVNYRGSTGFGRRFRDLLHKSWGVVDVEDCVAGAEFMVSSGQADANSLIIRGNSAGGYTALSAATFHDVFAVAAAYYGIGDLSIMAEETHKFELHYTDNLVGKLPEDQQIYDARSPLKNSSQLSCPVIFFQGMDDKVVLPSQSREMAAAVREKGLPVALMEFEGEGHGFRKATALVDSLRAELFFYQKVLGLPVTPEALVIDIENLDTD